MLDIRAVGRYDPYGRVLVIEEYDQEGMRAVRRRAVEVARVAGSFGLVLGTLGRQGNPRILEHIQGLLEKRGLPFTNVSGSTPLQASAAAASVTMKDFLLPDPSVQGLHAFDV